jgi:type IV pilus assembly protein PilB
MILPETLQKILSEAGFITPKDFAAAVKTADDIKKPITDILVFRGLISEDALGKLIAEYFKVPYVRLSNKIIPLTVLDLVPEQAAISFHIMPFAVENDVVLIGMENPTDIEALEFVKRRANKAVTPHYITPADFTKAVGQYKRNIKTIFSTIIEENLKKTKIDPNHLAESASDLPVIKILDTILEYGVAEGASDIHLNMLEDGLMVRFRVDGMLRDIATLANAIHPALVARIKILSELKIDEHRTPQDGRFKFKVHDDYISLRVSVLPTFFGENVVMRLLPESARPLSLEELGVSADALPIIHGNIKKPHGMILVTGPTGSGKTTTLYSVLNMLNGPEVNICTIEDPIEYSVRRINQTQVNAQAGLTFASGLRSLLRHDPDVMMIGEIRDTETAEIAIHSALTGHLVLSTLHTNSAAGAIPRFLDMGVQGFLLASTINLIIAQRLVRKICTNCMHKVEPSEEMLDIIKIRSGGKFVVTDFFAGAGCLECDGGGYRGRVGIYEILEVNHDIRELINKRASEEEILEAALKNGMTALMADGVNKISAGITTIEEVVRVTGE